MDRESPRLQPLAPSPFQMCIWTLWLPVQAVAAPCSVARVRVSLLVPVLPVPALTLLSDPSLVLDSVLPQHMLRLLCSGLKAGIGAAVEFAWCLHYIICR